MAQQQKNEITKMNEPRSPADQANPEGKVDFSALLKFMVANKGSDMFITSGFPPAIKINGQLQVVSKNPLSAEASKNLVINVMTPSQKEEFERTHECNFAIGVSG